jgi:hypothetical protein
VDDDLIDVNGQHMLLPVGGRFGAIAGASRYRAGRH